MSEENILRLPLWKACLDEMRETGFTYGASWGAEFFETRLRCANDTDEFCFAMINIRCAIEYDDGYSIKSKRAENGLVFFIPSAPGHEEVASAFDQKMRRYLVRAINLRSATLINPQAELTEGERAKMTKNLERDGIRLVLIAREKSVMKCLEKHQPKLLEK